MTTVSKQSVEEFVRPEGHECHVSTGVHECLTFGTGELDANGFWEVPCGDCAREHETQFPECGPCWPHTPAQLETMGLREFSI